jgi:hypothetical protein
MASDVKTPSTPSNEGQKDPEQAVVPQESDRLETDNALRSLVERFATEDEDTPPEPTEPKAEPEAKAEGPAESRDEGEDDTLADSKPEQKPPAEKAPEQKPGEKKPEARKPDPKSEPEGDPNEKEINAYSAGAQKRIRKLVQQKNDLRAEVEKLKGRAKYRDELDASLTKASIKQESWDRWTQLGFLVQTQPEKAADVLRHMADNLTGMRREPAREAPPEKADEPPPEPDLDADLKKHVEDFDMTAEVATKIQAERRRAAPRKEQQSTAPPPGDGLPRLSQSSVDKGVAAVAAVDAEFRAKFPDRWDELSEEVNTEMAAFKGVPPEQWGAAARKCAELVVARRVRAGVQPDPVLRGGGKRQVSSHDSIPSTREQLADRIARGELFSR